MSSDQTWAEALKISPESLSQWSQQAPAETPLLVWCLINGHVSTEEYLNWACDHFGLPVLNTAFFHQSFDHKQLQAVNQNPAWSAWCFPVGHWDDVTLLACTEPPQELPEGKFAFLLADPAAMNEVWGSTQSGNAGEQAAVPPPLEPEAPAGINPNATRTFVLNLDEANLLSDHADGVDPNPVKPDEKTGLTLSVVHDRNAAHQEKPAAKLKPAPTAKVKLAVEDTPPPTPRPTSKTSTQISAVTASEETEIAAAFEKLHEIINRP